MDHLMLVSETGHTVTCLCGNYQVSARAAEKLYSVAPVSNERLDGAAALIPRALPLLECREIKAIVITATFIFSALSHENVGDVVKIYRLQYAIFCKWLFMFIISFSSARYFFLLQKKIHYAPNFLKNVEYIFCSYR